MDVLQPLNGGQRNVKKTRKQLSLAQKTAMLNRIEAGEAPRAIAEEYGIHLKSLQKIKRKGPQLRQFVEKCKDSTRLHMKTTQMQDLDKALFNWFLQVRVQGIPVSGRFLCEKALQIHGNLPGPRNQFVASEGWLRNFKRRHGIREIHLQGEEGATITTLYVGELAHEIKKEGYDPRDVYSMDETGLCWKSLPTKTLAHAGERRADGGAVRKNRVTVAVCSNATGTHRLPLLMIGKYANPRCFKHVTNLPVAYMHQSKARITGRLFTQWLRTYFMSAVEKRQMQEGRSGKVILLVDNCHKLEGDTRDITDKINIKVLPPATTSLMQPTGHGLIVKMKRLFQKKFLRAVLQSPTGVVGFYKDYDLKDCADMVSLAWQEVTEGNLQKGWRKLFPTLLPADDTREAEDGSGPDEEEIAALLNTEAGGNLSEQETYSWLFELESAEEEISAPDTHSALEDEEVSDSDDEEEILRAFDVVLKWARKQSDPLTNMQAQTLYEQFTS